MTISEESRHRLYGRLEEVLGEEQAATVMEHLPPVGWADVATRRDVDHVAAEVRAEVAELRSQVAVQGTELRSAIATLGSELRVELASSESRLGSDLARVRSNVRTLFLGLVGLQLSGAGLAVAVSRLA